MATYDLIGKSPTNIVQTGMIAGWVWLGFWVGLATAEVTYQLDFVGTWSPATHPGAFPGSSSHFTQLVGGTHNGAVRFWEPGGFATPGIENTAEVGGTSSLLGEVQTAIEAGTAASTILGPSLFSLPNQASTSFTIDASHPLVTLVSMVAPSPDWFVGVSGLSLRENDQWLGQVTVELQPYDAGTEEGVGFSLSNPPTIPQEVIRKITGAPFAGLPPLGTLTFTIQPNELEGDFNLDGGVDHADIDIWKTGFGNFTDGSALVVDGDANNDGQVDGYDFMLWQQNYGRSLASSTIRLSVPEASSLSLLTLGLVVFLVLKSHPRRNSVELS